MRIFLSRTLAPSTANQEHVPAPDRQNYRLRSSIHHYQESTQKVSCLPNRNTVRQKNSHRLKERQPLKLRTLTKLRNGHQSTVPLGDGRLLSDNPQKSPIFRRTSPRLPRDACLDAGVPESPVSTFIAYSPLTCPPPPCEANITLT